MKRSCEARYMSDSQHCPRCRMTWDANDPDPPECLTDKEIGNIRLKEIRENLEKRGKKDETF